MCVATETRGSRPTRQQRKGSDVSAGRAAGSMLSLATCCALATAITPGCRAPRPPLSVEHEDPGIKIPAMKKAVREQDRSVVPQLVEDLASDDPAVRFFAIRALEELTGRTFEFQYFEDEEVRKAALEQWKQWLSEQPQ